MQIGVICTEWTSIGAWTSAQGRAQTCHFQEHKPVTVRIQGSMGAGVRRLHARCAHSGAGPGLGCRAGVTCAPCRVHTLAMPVVAEVPDMFRAIDGGATLALLAKLAVEKAATSKLEETRHAIQVGQYGFPGYTCHVAHALELGMHAAKSGRLTCGTGTVPRRGDILEGFDLTPAPDLGITQGAWWHP